MTKHIYTPGTIFRIAGLYSFVTMFIVVGMLFTAKAQAIEQIEPLEQIRSTVNKITNILREKSTNGTVTSEDQRKRIMAVVDERFNFREMSQRTLGVQWKQISQSEQDQFISLFSKLLQRTYIAKVESHSNDEVVYKGQHMEDSVAVVETGVMSNNNEIPITYRLLNEKGQWMVYDVIIENVSLVRNYRSQFQSILSKEKFSGLLKRMQDKIDKGTEEQK